MDLKEIVKMYGWNDYYDMPTGRIFHLSKAVEESEGVFQVPVSEDGELIGYAKLEV